MHTLCRKISLFLAYLLIALLGLMTVVVVWQVSGRYIPAIQNSATDEIARFMLIWLGIVGAAYVSGIRKHLAVDLFINKLPAGGKRKLELVLELGVIAFALSVMVWGGLDIVTKTLATGQVSPVLRVPMGWVYTALPIGGVCIVLFGINHVLECLNPDANAATATDGAKGGDVI
ncbi:MAG: TRAP transporter small permease [Methylobacteriaceae bacterium]|jgi:TRAP-type C4-dicarboxylate transport system permease small subunit|nr:TRAP transporter small permease [Methylobacteriaceae bacterium]